MARKSASPRSGTGVRERPAPAAPHPAAGAAGRLAVLGVVLLVAAVLAWRQIATPDYGFHLAAGRLILSTGAWPRLDPFTYTVSDHPYIDMNGLFQVALALAERAGGARGAALLQELLVLGAVGAVWAAARRRGARSAALLGAVMLLGVAAWELRFLYRPELVTYLLLAVTLGLVQRHAEDARPAWLYAAAGLQLVWTNAHTLSLLGPAVLGLYALTGLLGARRRDPHPWVAAGLAGLLLCASPYGLEGVRFVFGLATRLSAGNVFHEQIGELKSPFAVPLDRPLLAFDVLLASTAVLVLATLRRRRPFDVAVLVVFGGLAVSALRNVPLFVVAAVPVAAQAGQEIVDRMGRASSAPTQRRSSVARVMYGAVVAAGLIFAAQVATGRHYLADHRPYDVGTGPSPALFPRETLDVLATQRPPGPIFNPLRFGGALLERLWPREKVFIDGRLEVIGEAFYEEYAAANRGPGWDALVRRWNPRVALVPLEARAQVARLFADRAWALAGLDGVAALFVRRGPETDALVRGFEDGLRRLDERRGDAGARPVPRDGTGAAGAWARWCAPRRYAWDAARLGHFYLDLGYPEAARRTFARGLADAGWDEPDLVDGYARACEALGLRDEAARWRAGRAS